MELLKNNGYPKVGKVLVSKGSVIVYKYGAHKVLRLYYGSKKSCDYDYDLAAHLIKNPVNGLARIFSASVFRVKGDTYALAVVMRKYKVGSSDTTGAIPYGTRICTKRTEHLVCWDTHDSNVGYYHKDPDKKIVVFDMWDGVGCGISKVSYTRNSKLNRLKEKRIKKKARLKEDIRKMVPIEIGNCMCMGCVEYYVTKIDNPVFEAMAREYLSL